MTTVAILLASVLAAPISTVSPGLQERIAEGPQPGQRVEVRLRDGRILIGLVGVQLKNGFYLEPAADAPVVVRYDALLGIRDAATGEVMSFPKPKRWIKPVVLSAVGVTVFIVAKFIWDGFGQ